MVNKIEAARIGAGVIKTEDDSAAQVKQAIERVSSITAINGNDVSFEGRRIIEGHGFALKVNCYDIYECPNGYLLHTYMDTGANWAASGTTLEAMMAVVPDRAVARRAQGELIKKNLISFHQH